MDSTAWDERYAEREYVWSAEPNRFVEEHLAALAPGRAIDLGAGEGRNTVWLAGRGWRVTAVDFSEVGLAKCRRLAGDHRVAHLVETVRADITRYEPEEPVDLVLIVYLQVPAPEQVAILGRAAAWLRPGGTLFVVAHDVSNVEHGHGGPSRTEVCYDVDRTVAALDGLEIARAETAEREVETPEGQRTALDTLVIATRPAA
jgi:SAM-dependent methyltransferase